MPESEPSQPRRRPPVLTDEAASRRTAQLADLRSALAAQGVSSVLAGTHRLVLRGEPHRYEPSGPTDPRLYIFTPGGTDIATANGRAYLLASGGAYPAADPVQAARLFLHSGDGASHDDEPGDASQRAAAAGRRRTGG